MLRDLPRHAQSGLCTSAPHADSRVTRTVILLRTSCSWRDAPPLPTCTRKLNCGGRDCVQQISKKSARKRNKLRMEHKAFERRSPGTPR